MDLHEKYGLRRIINACGKMTALSGAKVLPPIASQATASLGEFFDLDELQSAASRVISRVSGAEAGCVTACTAAGLTESVAACLTGCDLGKVLKLPVCDWGNRRVLIQKGHCVNYGAPVTQNIRMAGAEVVEVGEVNRTLREHLEHELELGGVAAVMHVESHHTVQKGMLGLTDVVELSHQHGVPVIVDGAAQDQRIRDLIDLGVDLVVVSAHKYLCSTTGGIVAGRKAWVDAVYLQNRGIGRAMKAGKEAIFGAMAALEYREQEDMGAWTAEQDRKVALVLELLEGIDGVGLGVDADPNGCPFSRARITPDPAVCGIDVFELNRRLAEGDPSIRLRAHHANEGYLNIDAIELEDAEIQLVCNRIRELISDAKARF